MKTVLIRFILLASCFSLVNVYAVDDLDRSVVVLFGDSITVGFNSGFSQLRNGDGTITHGFPTIYLTDILNNGDEPRTSIVTNWGEGGTSTIRGLSRISNNLVTALTDYPAKDHYLLMLYGTNDQSFGISTSTTGFNIASMIDNARAVGIDRENIVVGTLLPRDDRDVTPYNTEIVSAVNSRGVNLVNLFDRFIAEPSGWRSLLEVETTSAGNQVRLHPTNEGYWVIAQTWFDEILSRLIEPDPVVVEPEVESIFITAILDILLSDE